MLVSLRHDAIVSRDDEQREIDAARAGQHGVHQPLVAWYVDEPEHLSVRERAIGITELDRDAAHLLFRQPVRVDPGERAHQGGLAVIDMTGGSDDHEAGPHITTRSIASCCRNCGSSCGSRQRTSSQSAPSEMRAMTGRGSRRSASSSRLRLACLLFTGWTANP